MDHIPCLESQLWQHIHVPFLCREEYDGLEFADYPIRKGWQDGSTKAINFSGRSRDEQSSFLQTWLFFGMLAGVLGVPVASQDFVVDGFVTTKRLSEYTSKWYGRLLSMPEHLRHECHMNSQRCLMAVRNYRFTLLDETRPDCLLTPEIRLSISILGETLSQVKHSIWRSFSERNPTGYIDVRGKWGSSKLLQDMLLEKKWCPNHVAFLENYPPAMSNIGLYYATSLYRPRMACHENCSIDACVAGKVADPKAYTTKHSNVGVSPCDGTCSKIEPTQGPILDILQRGGLPLLRASLSHRVVEVDVVEYQAGMEYVAFSHVWSDGLGNESHSWLPACQFAHLIEAINTAQRGASGSDNILPESKPGPLTALFWIDTICVPRGDANAKFRRMALDRMATPYQHSSMVLVLDAELYHTDLDTSLEAIMRLTCSNWMRRLWTLQEGILGGQRLHILFKGMVLDMWSELERFRQELWKEPWTCNPMIPFVLRTGIKKSAQATGSKRLSWLFKDMNWRSTTRKTDEALVLSSLLNITPPNMSQIPTKDWMRAVIAELREFPRRVIFAPGPRFREEGYRWALRSFLDRANFRLGSVMAKVQKMYFRHLDAEILSLEVSYPGYMLKGISELDHRPWDFVFYDRKVNKILHVKEKEKRRARLHDSQNADVVEGKGLESSHAVLGLILHCLAVDTIHAYGAVVRLDQASISGADSSPDRLSGMHDGSVDIYIYDKGANLAIEERVSDHIIVECSYAQETWILR